MTTTTSATSSTSTAATTATTSTASSASAIITALGAGSGIDIASLVSSLVTNQFSVEKAALATKADTLTTQISTVGTLQSGITSFSSALQSLISGGTLATQPTSSNTSVLNVTALPGAKLAKLSSTVQVQQLASAQAATTNATGQSGSDVIGTGTLTLNFGTATVDSNGAMTAFTAGSAAPVAITIDSSNNTMAGIASAINKANAGVTATVVSDVNGARLTIKSATGAAQAFTMTAGAGDTALSALNVGVGATGTSIGTPAKDAIVSVDGVSLQRSSNSISDLITGVKLDLVSVSTTPVTLGATRPTSSITEAVTDFVTTFNSYFASVTAATDPTSGTLKLDSATTNLQRNLSALTLTTLVSSTTPGAPLTLAAIGVGTNKDGTLSVDSAKLTQAMTNFPDEVEAMFAAASGTAATGNGLMGALADIATKATSAAYGLAASTLKYNAAKTTVADQQAQEVTDEADATTRLTAQYSAMDTRVTAYKATQSFLDQQIAAWNKSS